MNHYELKFEIKTDVENVIPLLRMIAKTVSKNMAPIREIGEFVITPTITDLTGDGNA
jgi:hypothetical protein